MVSNLRYEIADISLASEGRKKIEWAIKRMPTLTEIRKNFSKEKPLKNIRIGACLHITPETANLMLTLKDAGAKVALCSSNPLSTQDDIAAALVKHFNIAVFGINNIDNKGYYRHINKTISTNPQIVLDDGADLTKVIHSLYGAKPCPIYGGLEETTTGVIRIKALAKDGKLLYPVIAVNDARTKNLFDNRYGTGQSTIDGILRATNTLLAGKTFVIAGYGWCGKGLAQRARGMGAKVVITEVDPIKALEAIMDGFQVMKMIDAVKIADIICTVTGNKDVITKEHFYNMKDGVILSNSGHFNVEINIDALKKISKKVRHDVKKNIDEYILPNNKSIYLLAQGRLVNLSCAEGHPADVMDMSFSTQALSCKFIVENKGKLQRQVYNVPVDIEETIANIKLKSMQVSIDKLSEEQKKYLRSWQYGT